MKIIFFDHLQHKLFPSFILPVPSASEWQNIAAVEQD